MPPKRYKKTNKFTVSESYNLSTAKFLIIVESPSKCPKIEHFLGEDYCCIASKGHLRQLSGLKSIDIKNTFSPSFTVIPEKKEHIVKMKETISKFSKSNIFLAMDDDREGEAIAWHICDIFGLPLTTPRILFHEITKSAIQTSINTPTIVNMPLVMAQQARQILDIIVGYKVSPFLWKYLYNNKENSLSAGRCQTPALRLIYENNLTKNADCSQQYKISSVFTDKKYDFSLNKQFENNEYVLDFLNKSKDFSHILSIGSQTTHKKGSPKPFSTSRLLQIASNQLSMSPKETMSLCQQLYQSGLITYMRTESNLYSKDFVDKITKMICEKFSTKHVGNTEALNNSNSNNPHEAIRVIQLDIKTIQNCENPRLNTLYKLIWRTTLESCMSDARYQNTNIEVSAPDNHKYKMVLEMPVFYGWKALETVDDITTIQSKVSSEILYLKSLSSQPSIPYHNISALFYAKNSHSYYTEASLISKLESLEIGRPSTYSTIIETIKDRGYVNKMDSPGHTVICKEYNMVCNEIVISDVEKTFGNEKNKLIIQPVGILALEFLIENFSTLFSYEYTKNMEKQLDDIANEVNTEWKTICKTCYNDITEIATNIKQISKQSYEIEPDYDFVFDKYGPIIRHTLPDGNIEYLPGNKDLSIDIDKLKQKEYTLTDLLEPSSRCLGKYEDNDIYLKNGRYGYYVEWGEKTESMKEIEIPISELTFDNVIEHLNQKKENQLDNSMLRTITPNMSVRRGKYGAYVFFKSPSMKKPKFLNIKKFPEGFLACSPETIQQWLSTQYNIKLKDM
jgi:DNA topoisomerase-1